MAKTKWRCREYNPSANQTGSHSFYAEAVINSDLTNEEPEEPNTGGNTGGGGTTPPEGGGDGEDY